MKGFEPYFAICFTSDYVGCGSFLTKFGDTPQSTAAMFIRSLLVKVTPPSKSLEIAVEILLLAIGILLW
jgi:hypothetical protein